MGNKVSATKRTRLNLTILVFAATVFALFGARVFAETNDAPNILKVSPVRSDITVQAGETKTVEALVTNLTDSPITVQPIANDFIAGDESGTPALILDADKYAPTHSLKRFMTDMGPVTVPAKETLVVNVVIAVPAEAQAGGYFGAIRFAPTVPDSGGQVNMSASVASLILLTVPGDMKEQMTLTDFEIKQGSKVGTFFGSANDIAATVRFENKGNVQLAPFGKLSVKQGDKVVYETDFNAQTPRDMTLPDSARRWEIPLKNIGSFGHYTVNATFTYGSKNVSQEVTKSFWVVPLSVILWTAGGLLALIGLIIGIWIFLRNYKRRILRSQSGRSYRR